MFKVTILSAVGFSPQQQLKLNSASEKFEAAMNSDQLKYRIINFRCPLGEMFDSNQGLTNEQIFRRLYAGEESYLAGSNNTADLYLVMKNKWKNILAGNQPAGFGDANEKEIGVYSWWFDRAKDYEYAGFLAHEWSHKLGFDHSPIPTPTRECSVPYAFGRIVEEIAKDIK